MITLLRVHVVHNTRIGYANTSAHPAITRPLHSQRVFATWRKKGMRPVKRQFPHASGSPLEFLPNDVPFGSQKQEIYDPEMEGFKESRFSPHCHVSENLILPRFH